MEIIQTITKLMCNKKIDKMHFEFWEKNEEDGEEHLVKIDMEKEYY